MGVGFLHLFLLARYLFFFFCQLWWIFALVLFAMLLLLLWILSCKRRISLSLSLSGGGSLQTGVKTSSKRQAVLAGKKLLSVHLSPQQKTWENLYPDFSLSMQSSNASSSKCKLHISHILECSIFDQQVCNCTPNIVLVHGLHTHIHTWGYDRFVIQLQIDFLFLNSVPVLSMSSWCLANVDSLM